jgi:dihydrofolate reductase
VKAILSADMNWGIGYKGKLLQRVPEDMRFFAEMTKGRIVVMGRETLESLPGQQPLKDRVNIVLTRSGNLNSNEIIICRSLEELFERLKDFSIDDVYVIGGESVYTQLLPYCSEAYVTRFEKEFEADRHFPDLDHMDDWMLVSESAESSYKGMSFKYLRYVNNNALPIQK